MGADARLTLPVFEIGLKAYLYGDRAVELAMAADRASIEHGVTIIFTPQYVDIPRIAAETEHLLVFAQHLDGIPVGPGNGSVLPEAIKAAGAAGAILNHAEKRITLREIARTIRRAHEAGLLAMVCADSPEEGVAIAHLGPDLILAEPPELIGGGTSVGKGAQGFVAEATARIKAVNPKIVVLTSAGIRTSDDVREIVRLGAEATGSTSGIVKAEDPVRAMEDMVRALKEAWLERHPTSQAF
jgi:triosephosphate isomerase (TIM)